DDGLKEFPSIKDPKNLNQFVGFLEESLQRPVVYLSDGPEQSQIRKLR
ncbi:unnamed protein product, partial [marine sediment metagenome]